MFLYKIEVLNLLIVLFEIYIDWEFLVIFLRIFILLFFFLVFGVVFGVCIYMYWKKRCV